MKKCTTIECPYKNPFCPTCGFYKETTNIHEIRSKGLTLCNTKCYECSDIDCPSHPINNSEE
jgi:hypothetical protein